MGDTDRVLAGFEPPEWFKQLNVKQIGLSVWFRLPEFEFQQLAERSTGKGGRQLRRYYSRYPGRAYYYIRLRKHEDGHYERPFAVEKKQWETMPWIS